MSKILTKCDLKRYLEIESQLYSRSRISEFLFPSCIGQLLSALRHLEYYTNRTGVLSSIMKIFYHIRYRKLRLLTGLTIPPNTCAEGLTIYHTGSVVINSATKIGRNCCIMNNVNIGANGGSHKAPKIGDNVYIGPGAVIFGDIEIADGCYVGANAVVNKSFLEPNSVIVGIPAKVVKKDNVCWWEKNHLKRHK